MSYPKIARVLRWEREAVERFLKQVYLRSVILELPADLGVEVPEDPSDSPILAGLVVSKAEYLVTGDSDLLAHKGHYPVVTPAEFAGRL